MRLRRILAFGLCALVPVAVAFGAKPKPKPQFGPKTLAGKWTGTWTNTTFGSTGPASIVAKATTKTLAFTADFGGNVFGCPDPDPESAKPLTKGKGPNRWSAAGFAIHASSKALGELKLTYTHANRTLRGGGQNPACAVNLKWTVLGKFTAKTFAGTVNITLPDGAAAVSKIALTRR